MIIVERKLFAGAHISCSYDPPVTSPFYKMCVHHGRTSRAVVDLPSSGTYMQPTFNRLEYGFPLFEVSNRNHALSMDGALVNLVAVGVAASPATSAPSLASSLQIIPIDWARFRNSCIQVIEYILGRTVLRISSDSHLVKDVCHGLAILNASRLGRLISFIGSPSLNTPSVNNMLPELVQEFLSAVTVHEILPRLLASAS